MMHAKLFESVEALQADLDAWLHHYNHERPHLRYRNQGVSPGRPFSDLSDKEAKRTRYRRERRRPLRASSIPYVYWLGLDNFPKTSEYGHRQHPLPLLVRRGPRRRMSTTVDARTACRRAALRSPRGGRMESRTGQSGSFFDPIVPPSRATTGISSPPRRRAMRVLTRSPACASAAMLSRLARSGSASAPTS